MFPAFPHFNIGLHMHYRYAYDFIVIIILLTLWDRYWLQLKALCGWYPGEQWQVLLSQNELVVVHEPSARHHEPTTPGNTVYTPRCLISTRQRAPQKHRRNNERGQNTNRHNSRTQNKTTNWLLYRDGRSFYILFSRVGLICVMLCCFYSMSRCLISTRQMAPQKHRRNTTEEKYRQIQNWACALEI